MNKLSILILALVAVHQLEAAGPKGQCGGEGYKGDRSCWAGTTCQHINQWWHECKELCQPYKQCGGKNWQGGRQCTNGFTCTYINEFWSDCKPGNGGGNSNPTSPPSGGGNNNGGGGKPLPTGKWPFGKFSWGKDFDNGDRNYDGYDFTTVWIAWNDIWGEDNHGNWCRDAKQQGKIAIVYGYLIAFMARKDWGLQDCDVHPTNNLCHKGGSYLKSNRAKVISKYGEYAARMASCLGASHPAIFMIEPDFWQYYGDHTQDTHLDGPWMRSLYDDIVVSIRKALPNARFSFDISAWIGEEGFRKWWSFFASAPYIEFCNTSGGQARADANIKPNELTYAFVSRTTGKKIIADCGYGVAGADSGNCGQWNNPNTVNDRIRDGVIAVNMRKAPFKPYHTPKI